MKNSHDKQALATGVLLLAGVIGGLAPLGAKIILRELPPLTVLFVRLTIMLAVLLPLVHSSLVHILSHWKKILIVGLFWSGNVTLFILGIGYTTSFASQLLYAGVPIILLAEQMLLTRRRTSVMQTTGVLLGFAGVVTILLDKSESIHSGTLRGNLIILLASFSWALYMMASKRVSQHVGPLMLTAGAALVAWVLAGASMLIVEGVGPISRLSSLSLSGWGALVFLGILLGVVMIYLYQWGVKHGSTVVAGSMTYVSTLVGAVSGVLFLGEGVTVQFLFGAGILLSGVFFASTLPELTHRSA